MTVNNIIDMIIGIISVVVGVAGLFFSTSVIKKGIRSEIFIYYTNLSNFAVILYQILLVISYTSNISVIKNFVMNPVVRISVMFMIMLTFVIYHFILRSALKKKRAEKMSPGRLFGDIVVHYFIPISTLIQWIFCANKQNLNVLDGLVWLVCPTVYMVVIFIRGMIINIKCRKDINYFTKADLIKYPYMFMDVDTIGIPKVAVLILLIGLACASVGCITVWFTILFSA